MEILNVFLYVYLGLGTIYGLYLLFNGSSTIWELPINIIGGPVVAIYIIIKTLRKGPSRRD
jgi:hypothetical protein